MKLGKLGEQVVIISEKASNALTFVEAIPASGLEYHEKYPKRDTSAREEYKELRDNSLAEERTYVMDIIRGKWNNDDTRLQ